MGLLLHAGGCVGLAAWAREQRRPRLGLAGLRLTRQPPSGCFPISNRPDPAPRQPTSPQGWPIGNRWPVGSGRLVLPVDQGPKRSRPLQDLPPEGCGRPRCSRQQPRAHPSGPNTGQPNRLPVEEPAHQAPERVDRLAREQDQVAFIVEHAVSDALHPGTARARAPGHVARPGRG
jgi:hypothetical protein